MYQDAQKKKASACRGSSRARMARHAVVIANPTAGDLQKLEHGPAAAREFVRDTHARQEH